jgi:protein-S-isoprenylcysteine O-methyltransferase Ste14
MAPEETDPAEPDHPGIVAPPPLIYLAGLLLGLALGVAVRPPALPGVVAWPLGVVMAVAGLALAFAFVREFSRARTPVDPWSSTTAIVTSGPYRISRNPGYLAFALVYAGIAVVTGGTWAFVTLVPTLLVMDRLVIAREERYLERKFGEEYRRYKARTRRWL